MSWISWGLFPDNRPKKKISGFSYCSATSRLTTCRDDGDKFWIQRYEKFLFRLHQTQASAAIFHGPLGTDVGFPSRWLTKHLHRSLNKDSFLGARANSAERHWFPKISSRKVRCWVDEMKSRFSAPGKFEGKGVKMTFQPLWNRRKKLFVFFLSKSNFLNLYKTWRKFITLIAFPPKTPKLPNPLFCIGRSSSKPLTAPPRVIS